MHNQIKISNSLKFILIIFMLFLGNVTFAAETGDNYTQVTVSSINELENAVSNATTDTRITVNDGVYTSDATLTGNTANVIIRAKNDHNVHFQNLISVRGNNITIEKCTIDGSNGTIKVYGNDVKILRNIWDNSGAEDWIYLEDTAYRTEIGYNTIKNRSANVINNSQVIVQFVNDATSTPYATYVHHNLFKDIVRSGKYSEVYLIYSGGVNPPQSIDNNIIIEYNLFDNAPGDGRMIDIKTNGVTVRNNTVINLPTNSSFKNRSGSRATFENNVFLGGNGQIAAQGDDNIIRGNYIEYNQDNSTDSAFRFYYGGDTSTRYNQMHNTLIENNTLVNAYYGFEFGRNGTGDEGTRPMTNTIIRGNKIINGGGESTTNGDVDFQGVIWEDNKYSGNGGKFASNMTLDESLTAAIPPHLSASDVGPYATSTTTSTTTVEPNVNTGAFTIAPGVLK